MQRFQFNYGSLIFKCSDCNKSYEKGFDEDLVKKFDKTYRFRDGDIISVWSCKKVLVHMSTSLREKYPNTELFLVRIYLYSD